MTACRVASPTWSPSGLPTTCGVKCRDGRPCPQRAGPFGACDEHADWTRRPEVPALLDPEWFERWYRFWLQERGRQAVLPEDLQRFLRWWATHPIVDKMQVPFSMDLYQLKNWWLVWCHRTGHPWLIPFELTLFCEWWMVT